VVVSGQSGETSIGILQKVKPQVPQRATSNDQPSVTVVDLSDPALAGQGIELVNLDALHLTSGVPFRARRVVVRLESSTVVYHSTNHRIRTRTKAQRGQLAYVIWSTVSSCTAQTRSRG
jgi:hypothetical protein